MAKKEKDLNYQIKNKKQLSPEVVWGSNENVIDDSLVFYDDMTMLEIKSNQISFYKLINPFSVDIPIYKWKRVLHNEGGLPSVESVSSDFKILDYHEMDKIIKREKYKLSNNELIYCEYFVYDTNDRDFIYKYEKNNDFLFEISQSLYISYYLDKNGEKMGIYEKYNYSDKKNNYIDSLLRSHSGYITSDKGDEPAYQRFNKNGELEAFYHSNNDGSYKYEKGLYCYSNIGNIKTELKADKLGNEWVITETNNIKNTNSTIIIKKDVSGNPINEPDYFMVVNNVNTGMVRKFKLLELDLEYQSKWNNYFYRKTYNYFSNYIYLEEQLYNNFELLETKRFFINKNLNNIDKWGLSNGGSIVNILHSIDGPSFIDHKGSKKKYHFFGNKVSLFKWLMIKYLGWKINQ